MQTGFSSKPRHQSDPPEILLVSTGFWRVGQVGLVPGSAGGLAWVLVLRVCPGATVQTCRLGAWVHGGRPGSGFGPDGSWPLALARKGSVRRQGIMAYAWPLSPQCCTGAAGTPRCGGGSGPRPAGRAGRSEASSDFVGKPPVSSHRSIHHSLSQRACVHRLSESLDRRKPPGAPRFT